MTAKLCDGRVCVVTGAGRGIGREHALLLASLGAKVVVNDIGVAVDGVPGSVDVAAQVVEEIRSGGGEALANTADSASWDGAQALVAEAVDRWGRLDVVVNNAGITRDRMLVNMSEEEWDSVIRVHLKTTFALSHFAAVAWRDRSKAGEDVEGRIINTTSTSGIYGNVGQTNYGTAKAGIAAFTIIAADELARYGVTVNALCPTALTRMTADLPLATGEDAQEHRLDPRWISPLCAWLASTRSAGVTGRVFPVSGRFLAVAEGWHRGPTAPAVDDTEAIDEVVRGLLAQARPNATMLGLDRD